MSSDLCSLEDTLAEYQQNNFKSRVAVFRRHSGTRDGCRTKVAGGEKSLDRGRCVRDLQRKRTNKMDG